MDRPDARILGRHRRRSHHPLPRYGLATWDGPGDAWRLDGRYGQYVLVDGSRDAVVTITAHEEERDHRLAELAVAAVAEAAPVGG